MDTEESIYTASTICRFCKKTGHKAADCLFKTKPYHPRVCSECRRQKN